MTGSRLFPLALLFSMTGFVPMAEAADISAGKESFHRHCAICHSDEPEVNKLGPSLYGVVGRRAGSIADYAYSDANKSSGIVWTTTAITRYLAGPQQMVPGTKMTFPGLPDESERADVVAYLNSLGGSPR